MRQRWARIVIEKVTRESKPVLLEGVLASCGQGPRGTGNTAWQRSRVLRHGFVIPKNKCLNKKKDCKLATLSDLVVTLFARERERANGRVSQHVIKRGERA
jgi:hypothetical protein